MIALGHLPAAAFEGWATMFELFASDSDGFLVIGGQMMQLLAAEHGAVELVRPTLDVDVVVDLRLRRGGTRWLSSWLRERSFEFMGAGPENVGHRFSRPAVSGPGMVSVDVLAPEGLGTRADTSTVPPARTVQVPGSAQAFARSDVVEVTASSLDGDSANGVIRRPNVLGALVAKAAATSIVARTNPERDWQDAALLLSIIEDPIAAVEACEPKDVKRLRALEPLTDPRHPGWLRLDAEMRARGAAALDFLVS